MDRSKRTYKVLGAALLTLLAVGICGCALSNSGKGEGNAQDAALLDEKEQTRVEPLAQKTDTGASEKTDAEGEASVSESASDDTDEEAREYDRNGQAGDPPSGWKDDYAHWDSEHWGVADLAMVGVPQMDEVKPSLIYKPTPAQQRRMDELSQELAKAAEKGLLSMKPKFGFVRVEFGKNDFVYSDPRFVNRLNEVAAEQVAINEAGMKPVYGNSYYVAMSRGANHDLFKIVYFRKPDGVLVREVILPDGDPMEFTAGPPPDLSQFKDHVVESMKNKWASFWEKHTARR